jgi:hypothetical protein
VTRAAEVPRLETERLMSTLHGLRIASPLLVVNAVTLRPGDCSWCRRTARKESRETARLAARCRLRSRECAIILAPLAAPPPRGLAALTRWGETWMP